MNNRALAVFIIGILNLMGLNAMASTKQASEPVDIVLVGASIGEGWNLPALPKRAGLSGYRFGYRGVYDFDKSKLINEIVSAKTRPDYVMVKECSTYFPRDPETYKRDIPAWVATLRAQGVRPILVTAAPVGQSDGFVTKAKGLIKAALGKPTWLQSITEYNDWLKQYAAQERIPVFDLEAVLRQSEIDRRLRKDYDRGDLVHLTPAAYSAVDKAFIQFLRQLES